jgi:hypothetical protein
MATSTTFNDARCGDNGLACESTAMVSIKRAQARVDFNIHKILVYSLRLNLRYPSRALWSLVQPIIPAPAKLPAPAYQFDNMLERN